MEQTMNLTESVAKLQAVLPALKANDAKFASDLIGSFKKYGKLTPKQTPWVSTLIARATAPKAAPAAINVGGFGGVVALFTTAKEHLKFPKIVLSCGGKVVKLSVAGPTSKAPGSINVMGEGTYPDREWFGRVSPDGAWVPSMKTAPEFVVALTALLTEFGQNPAKVAKEHGKLTGNCCFCNAGLTDPHSTAAGFGPVCADHYGLKAEWKMAVAKADHAAKQVEVEAAFSGGLLAKLSEPVVEEKPVVKCFFCEKAVTETKVLLGYTVCLTCAKQLV